MDKIFVKLIKIKSKLSNLKYVQNIDKDSKNPTPVQQKSFMNLRLILFHNYYTARHHDY